MVLTHPSIELRYCQITSKPKKSHNRKLRDKKDDLELVAVITHPERGVGKEEEIAEYNRDNMN